jgi:hypothetical protein
MPFSPRQMQDLALACQRLFSHLKEMQGEGIPAGNAWFAIDTPMATALQWITALVDTAHQEGDLKTEENYLSLRAHLLTVHDDINAAIGRGKGIFRGQEEPFQRLVKSAAAKAEELGLLDLGAANKVIPPLAAPNMQGGELDTSGNAVDPRNRRGLEAIHSDDFRSVKWFGTEYNFTSSQAAVVAQMWRAWERGVPEASEAFYLSEAGLSSTRARDVFKGNPAWEKMIAPGKTKGTIRLQAPE